LTGAATKAQWPLMMTITWVYALLAAVPFVLCLGQVGPVSQQRALGLLPAQRC